MDDVSYECVDREMIQGLGISIFNMKELGNVIFGIDEKLKIAVDSNSCT
jgi:hypothetical protein